MTDDLETVGQAEEPVEQVESAVVSDDDAQIPRFNKIQMSDVVKREKQKAYEKGRSEALMELQQQAEQAQSPAPAPTLGGMAQMSPDDIRRMIAEQAPQLLQDHVQQLQTKQTVDSFVSKMQAAEARHPGLEAKLNDLDYSTLAPIVQMANDMENTADIMKELLDNPMKMGNLVSLMYTQPKLAAKAMHDLSNSIKQNEAAIAENQTTAKEPLSQIKTSNNAGMDNGSMSVTDFRKLFRG